MDNKLSLSPETRMAVCDLLLAECLNEPVTINRWLFNEVLTQLYRFSENCEYKTTGLLADMLQKFVDGQEILSMKKTYCDLANTDFFQELSNRLEVWQKKSLELYERLLVNGVTPDLAVARIRENIFSCDVEVFECLSYTPEGRSLLCNHLDAWTARGVVAPWVNLRNCYAA